MAGSAASTAPMQLVQVVSTLTGSTIDNPIYLTDVEEAQRLRLCAVNHAFVRGPRQEDRMSSIRPKSVECIRRKQLHWSPPVQCCITRFVCLLPLLGSGGRQGEG
ncbi:uncharacterized protein [Triticum aestivum]|uniref:uncharacterized protein n=1 Tax=Triticum aestivum TaxID=4565 RepID=UPI001D001FE8|nr:uncharacterized protein LOC123047623 [Triticum aestivum]